MQTRIYVPLTQGGLLRLSGGEPAQRGPFRAYAVTSRLRREHPAAGDEELEYLAFLVAAGSGAGWAPVVAAADVPEDDVSEDHVSEDDVPEADVSEADVSEADVSEDDVPEADVSEDHVSEDDVSDDGPDHESELNGAQPSVPATPVGAVRVAEPLRRRQVASYHVADATLPGDPADGIPGFSRYSWYDATELAAVLELLGSPH